MDIKKLFEDENAVVTIDRTTKLIDRRRKTLQKKANQAANDYAQLSKALEDVKSQVAKDVIREAQTKAKDECAKTGYLVLIDDADIKHDLVAKATVRKLKAYKKLIIECIKSIEAGRNPDVKEFTKRMKIEATDEEMYQILVEAQNRVQAEANTKPAEIESTAVTVEQNSNEN